jgi:hypothetical protein
MMSLSKLPGTKLELTHGALWAAAVLLILTLVVGAANLWASYQFNQNAKAAEQRTVQAQQRQGREITVKLCHIFGGIAALKPPAGSAAANPSRAYEQNLHGYLAQVPSVLNCPR